MSILRLFSKAFILASRSRKRFFFVTIIYSALIGFTAYFINSAIADGFTPTSVVPMVIVISASVLISILYANQLVNNRKIEIATFKCIGWKNSHVRALIVGEIFSVTFIGFIIIIEFIFHWISISVYIKTINNIAINPTDIVPIGLGAFVLTFGLILGVQIVGIILANVKILKVRPIQALQMKS
ncbi:MAG: FtsX-like permease family protein [Promethearchaeota archaeon]